MRWASIPLCLIFPACAQPPSKEIDMTAARVARAREAEADLYAEGFFRQAEAALQEARESLAGERYASAIQAAAIASIQADEARARAILKKHRTARRAKRQLQEILSLLDEARSLRAEARDPDSLQSLADRLSELERALQRGESPAEVLQAGAELKKDSLEFLDRLRQR